MPAKRYALPASATFGGPVGSISSTGLPINVQL